MTQVEQVQLANEKVAHWKGKVERAAGILHKWEGQLAKLQAKGAKPVEPTIDKLPPLVIDPKVVSFVEAKAKGPKKPKKSRLRNQPIRASLSPCPTLQRKAHGH